MDSEKGRVSMANDSEWLKQSCQSLGPVLVLFFPTTFSERLQDLRVITDDQSGNVFHLLCPGPEWPYGVVDVPDPILEGP